MQASQVGSQLVGSAIGKVSDVLKDQHVWGFKDGGYLRTALEAGGNAGIAAATGGNAGAAAASTILGNIAASQTRQLVGDLAGSLTDNPKFRQTLTNALSNIIASGAGAAGGLAFGTDHSTGINALNGAAAASAIQQYNQAAEKFAELGVKEGGAAAGALLAAVGAVSDPHLLEDFLDDAEHAASQLVYSAESSVSDWISQTMAAAHNDAPSEAGVSSDKAEQEPPQATSPSPPPENEPPEDDKNTKSQNESYNGTDGNPLNLDTAEDAPENFDKLSDEAKDVFDRIQTKGSPYQGYKGGGKYHNNPREGDELLPKKDDEGNPITYREWDVSPRKAPDRSTRDAKRFVTGSDGRAYYTEDHYHTFSRIK